MRAAKLAGTPVVAYCKKGRVVRRRMERAESTLIGHDARSLTRAQEKTRLRSARGGVICTISHYFRLRAVGLLNNRSVTRMTFIMCIHNE